ncbi:MAG: Ig-like domain-containing protein, partial [Aeromonas sp.]
MSEGDYTAAATVTDPAGHKAEATDPGSVDLTAPTITVDAPDNSTDTTPTITGTTDVAPGTTVTIVVTDSKGNEQTLTTTVKPDGSYSVDVEKPLSEGDYTADATVTDPAGHKAEATDPGSVDSTPPSVVVDIVDASLNGNNPSSEVTFTFSEKVEGFDGTDLVVVGGKVTNLTTTDNITWTGTFTADPDFEGEASVTVPAGSYTDMAGNLGTAGEDTVPTDTLPPALSIVLDPNITPDDIINVAEQKLQIPITGKVGGDFNVGDTVTLTVGTKYFSGKVLDKDGNFSINVSGRDLVTNQHVDSDGKPIIDASVTTTDAAGNSMTATDDETYTVDTTLPSLRIELEQNITEDDYINITESGVMIPISGIVSGEFNVGDTVTLTVNGNKYTGPVVDKAGHFTIEVAGVDLQDDPDKTIDASVTSTDAAGNTNTAVDTETYFIDVTPPANLAIVLDPNITPDDIINAAEEGQNIPVSGTVSGGEFKAGDIVTLTVNNKTFTGPVDASGRFTIDVAGSDLVADPDHVI